MANLTITFTGTVRSTATKPPSSSAPSPPAGLTVITTPADMAVADLEDGGG